MKISSGRLYYLLPFLYLGIFALLVVVQFSRNEFFTQSLGEITISGRRPVRTAAAQEEVVDLQVAARNLIFPFSSSRPLLLETTDGTIYKLRAESWNIDGSKLLVLFQRGIKVSFFMAQGGREVQVLPTLPSSLKDVKRIALAYNAQDKNALERDNQLPILKTESQNKTFYTTLNGTQDRVDDEYLHFYVRTGAFKSLVIESSAAKSTFDYWMGKQGGSAGQTAFRQKITDFWEEAWQGWNQSRYLADLGQWRTGGTSPRFSEEIALAYLSTALERGTLPAASAKVATGATLNPDRWTFDAQPFLGNLMDTTTQFRRYLTNLEESLQSRGTLKLEPRVNLAQEAFHLGSENFYLALEKWLLTTDPKEATLREAAYLMANLYAFNLFKPNGAVEERLMLVINNRILPSIHRGSWGTVLENERGFLDTQSTLLAGFTLSEHGQREKDERLEILGRGLILSALALKNSTGALPEILQLENGQIKRTEGMVFPELIYPFHEIEKIQAQFVPLNKFWDRKSFIRTVAPLDSLSITSSQAFFRFSFPQGEAHHLVIQGVEPFSHITLHNNRWRTDPTFQRYSDGWFYSASTKTLFVKITHRQRLVELTIHFQGESPPAAPPPESSETPPAAPGVN